VIINDPITHHTRRYTTLWNTNVRKKRQEQTDIVISDKLQGSVATWLRCGGIVNNHFTAELQKNRRKEEFWKPVKTWRRYYHIGVFLELGVHTMHQCQWFFPRSAATSTAPPWIRRRGDFDVHLAR